MFEGISLRFSLALGPRAAGRAESGVRGRMDSNVMATDACAIRMSVTPSTLSKALNTSRKY